MKKYILTSILLMSILIFGCTEEKPIGGERDEHGCLGAAGYSWNEDVGACIREWELSDEQRQAAKTAIVPLSFPVTVVEVKVLRCSGCFAVNLQRNDNQEQITKNLANWKIVESIPEEEPITNFEQCVAAGNPVMESYPRQCRAGDQTFTEVISHVCTPEEKSADVCTMDYNPVCGDNGKTYANGCTACASGEIDSWTLGECDKDVERLTLEEAIDIAQNTECTEKGTLTDNSFYNENTKTWWIDLDMKPEFENELCNPACVIFEETKAVEINWRCTGALPP